MIFPHLSFFPFFLTIRIDFTYYRSKYSPKNNDLQQGRLFKNNCGPERNTGSLWPTTIMDRDGHKLWWLLREMPSLNKPHLLLSFKQPCRSLSRAQGASGGGGPGKPAKQLDPKRRQTTKAKNSSEEESPGRLGPSSAFQCQRGFQSSFHQGESLVIHPLVHFAKRMKPGLWAGTLPQSAISQETVGIF